LLDAAASAEELLRLKLEALPILGKRSIDEIWMSKGTVLF